MGVLLQGFFKLPPNQAVPSPTDGDAAVPWWWDHIAAQANDLRLSGFTAIWIPPALKANGGEGPTVDGYGPFDDYDIGSREQMGSIPTRFGSREQLQRCIAVLRANGLDVYVDLVEHHRSGDPGNFIFRYPGADGTPDIGRFPKNPSNFLPQAPRDPDLGGPVSDDKPFGREFATINSLPLHYVFDNLISAADWLTRSLGIQGYRLDDVKGISTDFLLPFLNSDAMAGKFAVGEFFDGNRVLVNGWIFNPTGMQGRPSAFDFPLRGLLQAMCNDPGRFNMSDLDHAGLIGISPLNAVTFVENHDTALQPSQLIEPANKILGYAYILTSEGYPCVYYGDYSTDADCLGLKPLIDNLIWIHENLAAGTTQQRWKDFDVFAYERTGAPGLLVGLNNDPGAVHTITVQTNFGPNVTLHDYTGHQGDVVTDGNGSAVITVPQNINGAGYVCYSRDGFGDAFTVTPQPATQVFEGAADLDILPATNGKTVPIGRIWCDANSAVQATLTMDRTQWSAATVVTVGIDGPDGTALGSLAVGPGTPPNTALQVQTGAAGFYALHLQAASLPTATAAFTLSTTFSAPQLFVPAAATTVTARDPSVTGQWSDIVNLKNVPIHTHVLPTGKVLYWGRRQTPGDPSFDSLNEHACHAFIYDPATRTDAATAGQPRDANGNTINLFCSNHTFLADGRLMVVGGHLFDSCGIPQATIYDPFADTWTAGPTMNEGRWYPSAVTLADGGVFVCSGSFATGVPGPPPPRGNPIPATNDTPQIWNNAPWVSLANFNESNQNGLPLFPRVHLAPDGRVFMSGALVPSFFFDTAGNGAWIESASRAAGPRDYAPSVLYDNGKILFVGGGGGQGTPPTDIAEIIDLTQPAPAWKKTQPMHFPRRQHNGTILPDGTVLVTGGTQGGGGPTQGFNDVRPGEPIHAAELWNPQTQTWTILAEEAVDRCYHSTAVLLPDGTVLSAGGGEYQPVQGVFEPNDPGETHANGQIFSPPYLFKGPRPVITNCPDAIQNGEVFQVGTPTPGQIEKISLIRLPSVTHSFDQNQRISFLTTVANANSVTATIPVSANVCPPGHYMLFLLNQAMVPSVAHIVHIQAPVVPAIQPAVRLAARIPLQVVGPVARDAAIVSTAKRSPVLVGLTATCPYGLAACWGGAYGALSRLPGVEVVRPMADQKDSVAFLYLNHDGLPDVANWRDAFLAATNGSYGWRGVEITLHSVVASDDGRLSLPADESRPEVLLGPLQPGDKVQLDRENGVQKPPSAVEAGAYAELASRIAAAAGDTAWSITGPIQWSGTSYVLKVRTFAP